MALNTINMWKSFSNAFKLHIYLGSILIHRNVDHIIISFNLRCGYGWIWQKITPPQPGMSIQQNIQISFIKNPGLSIEAHQWRCAILMKPFISTSVWKHTVISNYNSQTRFNYTITIIKIQILMSGYTVHMIDTALKLSRRIRRL